MRATGTAAGGAELDNVNQSVGIGAGASMSMSVTLSGLEAGENTIWISVSGQAYTGRPYRVVATYEP